MVYFSSVHHIHGVVGCGHIRPPTVLSEHQERMGIHRTNVCNSNGFCAALGNQSRLGLLPFVFPACWTNTDLAPVRLEGSSFVLSLPAQLPAARLVPTLGSVFMQMGRVLDLAATAVDASVTMATCFILSARSPGTVTPWVALLTTLSGASVVLAKVLLDKHTVRCLQPAQQVNKACDVGSPAEKCDKPFEGKNQTAGKPFLK